MADLIEERGGDVRLGWRVTGIHVEQAFTWIKNNTDKGAVFALDADYMLDADYITSADEDSQNFRAIAERSVVPDDSKDGGIASIAPDLTSEWIQGESAQKGLDRATDVQRMEKLRMFPLQWMVLSADAQTSF